jgi:hypothetical protein
MINQNEHDTKHAEALIINSAINDMIVNREYIDACRFTPDETNKRLMCLGDCYHAFSWFRWAKETAIRLWASGVAVPEEEF